MSVGRPVGQIPVSISYRIIELFSAGLYKSPNKAIEELVSNSWDALAQNVWIFLPADASRPQASIWTVDDGTGMDVEGLVELWQIASSPKESYRNSPELERQPIGKFGIGKLATYILARKLTYICRAGTGVHAVTMDFGTIDQHQQTDLVTLDIRKLEPADLEAALEPLRALPGGNELADKLISGSIESWTVATMSDLKPSAAQIKNGRVRWILSTALPMHPEFKLHLDGRPVEPSVQERVELVETWMSGAIDDHLPEGVSAGSDTTGPFIEIEGLAGRIRGFVELYDDVLTKGKATEWGRSHGFFVKVRGRLINLDDPLFGLPALSHSSFNRFRMEVEADGLDAYLASTREAIQENAAVRRFEEYLKAEFNRARAIYDTRVRQRELEELVASRVGKTAVSLSRRPLFVAVQRLMTGDIDSMLLTERPVDVTDVEAFLEALDARAGEDGQGLIDEVLPAPLGPERPIAVYDPGSRQIRVNILHPFYANFIEDVGRADPFDMLAVAEILTEAYMLEEGIEPEIVQRMLLRRDRFLRELVSANRLGPHVIAQNLRDMGDDADGLEDALTEALGALGFTSTKIGGKGHPDGLAKAVRGVRDGQRADYSLTYDAKSTGAGKVSAKTVGISTLNRHRRKYNAKYALVVAPDFEGGDDENSALCDECRADGVMVTPVRVDDLALLIEVTAAKMLGFSKLEELFRDCRTPNEAAVWIQAAAQEAYEIPPLVQTLEMIEYLQGLDRPVRVSAIALALQEKASIVATEEAVIDYVKTLRILAPGYIDVQGDLVTLETSVVKVRQIIARHYSELPSELRDHFLNKHLGAKAPDQETV